MAIVGGRPEQGVRVVLTRTAGEPAGDGPPWCYRGHVYLPDADFAATARVSADRSVAVEIAEGAPREIEGRVRRIVRSVARDPERGPPPRTIARWRAEK